MAKTKYILVTGGAGYIGSHTVVELIGNGYTPIILDDFRNSHKHVVGRIEEIVGRDVLFREVDVCDKEAFAAVLKEFSVEGIIHFAADKAVGESVESPLKYYHNNIQGLVNCLELAIEFNVENFVFSSSCTVYGVLDKSSAVTEETPMGTANSPYGFTKQIGEQIIADVIRSGAPLRCLNLRYFNPVGAHSSSLIGELPFGKPNNLLPAVTQTAVGKLPIIKVFGNDYPTEDGTCIRDYIHVSDLADAHVKGIQWLEDQEGSFSEVINVGTGKGTSVLEIISTFEEISGEKLNWEYAPRRAGDITEIYADVQKSKEMLNWQSQRSVVDAVRDAWNWELKLKND